MAADDKPVVLDAPASISEDWQVAYVWAFITKFGLMPKIRGLESLEDFEQCLREPVANRPDDVLEGICIRFLQNLKPGLRDVACTNIQHHLSKYISEALRSSEWTVWDPTWSPSEENRGGCCKPEMDVMERHRLGRLDEEALQDRDVRNPLKQIEVRGGGLFELEWYERARLLRQLVDWQLTHSEPIRERIKAEQARPAPKKGQEDAEREADSIKLEAIGLDRNKKRVWSLDDSARLYQSGNPFKRPCPLVALTTTRAQLEAQMEVYATHGAQAAPPAPKGTGPKGKASAAELRAHRALTQGIAAERALAEHIRDKILPKVDAHDKRVLKARRKEYERVAALQAAEERPSRTRRQTKVVNYRDLDEGVDYDSDEPRRGSRRAAAPVEPARPVIPGERRSARQRGRPVYDEDDYEDGPGSGAPASPAGNGNGNGNREAGPGGDEEGGSGSGSGSEWEDGAANGHNGSAVEPIEVDSD